MVVAAEAGQQQACHPRAKSEEVAGVRVEGSCRGREWKTCPIVVHSAAFAVAEARTAAAAAAAVAAAEVAFAAMAYRSAAEESAVACWSVAAALGFARRDSGLPVAAGWVGFGSFAEVAEEQLVAEER